MPIVCSPCKTVPCVDVCPVNALSHVNGVVRLDKGACVSCFRCNVRPGATSKDDSLPYKVRKSPVLTGPSAGKYPDETAFQEMLTLYYLKRG